MKIGIDARLWNETGVGRYIRNLVKYLYELDSGNEYVLFVRMADVSSIKRYVSPLRPAVAQATASRQGFEGQASKNWKIVITNVHWHSFSEQIKFPLLLYKENLDIMHFPYFSVPLAYKRPFIVTIHDLIIHHFPTGKASTLPGPVYQTKRFAYKAAIRHAVHSAKKIIVPLDSVKKDLIKNLYITESRIVVTHESVDEEIENANRQIINPKLKSEDYFLYVGNAYPHKNLDMLLSAFLTFKNEIKEHDVKLFLVGKEDYFYRRLEKKIKDEKINSVFIFHNIEDNLLHELYDNAIALIAPSFMEGFGLVPLEAMANQCLVIASDIPAHHEVGQNAAMYFDPYKAQDLKDVMVKVYTMTMDSKKPYKVLGLQRVKSFSWKHMAEQTLAVYESSVSVSK